MANKKKADRQNEIRKKRREGIETYDDLISYLDNNKNTELPFVQECWDKAVSKCDENKVLVADFDERSKIKGGVTDEERRKIGKYITSPVSMYFRLISLPSYSKVGNAIKYENDNKMADEVDSMVTLNLDSDDVGISDTSDEIMDWINMFIPNERAFLLRRYSSYMDTYDINAGADRAMFKRLLSLEIEGYRIDIARAKGKAINVNDEKKLNEMINGCLEANKWTKKQRNARDDMAQNRFTVWMDNMAKKGRFEPTKKEYPKDEIDYILDQIMESTKRVMS